MDTMLERAGKVCVGARADLEKLIELGRKNGGEMDTNETGEDTWARIEGFLPFKDNIMNRDHTEKLKEAQSVMEKDGEWMEK